MKARDIMTQPVVVVQEDTPLETVARTMLEHQIGGVPVVDAAGRLRGLLTESDFTGKESGLPFSAFRSPQVFGRWLPPEGVEQIYQAARSLPARDVMTSPVVTASEDTPVAELVRHMIHGHRTRIPIVRDGVPVGIVTRLDLLRLMLRGQDGESGGSAGRS